MRYGRKKLTETCGATNRRGLPCQCKLRYRGGKCKFHGGLSTGPKTPEGKRRSILNLLKSPNWQKALAKNGEPPKIKPREYSPEEDQKDLAQRVNRLRYGYG